MSADKTGLNDRFFTTDIASLTRTNRDTAPLVAKCLGTSQNIISHTFATMLFSHDHTQVGVRLLCFADTTFTCCYELSIFTQNKNVVLIHQGAGIPLLCPRIRFRYFLCPTIRLWHKSVRRNRTMNPFYLGNSRSIFNIFLSHAVD